MPPIYPVDADRFHAASRSIEDDLHEAYYSCRSKYGADIAGVLLVFALRQKLNDQPNSWPPPNDLREKVNDFLREHHLME